MCYKLPNNSALDRAKIEPLVWVRQINKATFWMQDDTRTRDPISTKFTSIFFGCGIARNCGCCIARNFVT